MVQCMAHIYCTMLVEVCLGTCTYLKIRLYMYSLELETCVLCIVISTSIVGNSRTKNTCLGNKMKNNPLCTL